MNVDDYRVELARPDQTGLLAEIERAAAQLFPEDVLTPEVRQNTVPHEQLENAQAEGRLWIAATDSGTVVGFAIAAREFNAAYLQEIDVHPDHQRKGLGRRLIGEVIRWARMQQLSCVLLTTFEHVPWNAPFYKRLGFETLAEHELTGDLLARLQFEQSQGMWDRVAMRLPISDTVFAMPCADRHIERN